MVNFQISFLLLYSLFSFQGTVYFGTFELPLMGNRRQRLLYAPLAQLVEHLTLNQGVPGSNP